MMIKWRLALCLSLVIGWMGGVNAQPTEIFLETPPSAIKLKTMISEKIRSRPDWNQADIGIVVEVLKSGRIVYAHQGEKPLIPASNLKIMTTAMALNFLGPDYQFSTHVYAPSHDTKGVAEGDLVIKGTGDPSMSTQFYQSSLGPFLGLASRLKELGYLRFTGDLVVDDSTFDRQYLGKGYHERYHLDDYAAPIGGLNVAENVIDLKITGKKIEVKPATSGVLIRNQIDPSRTHRVSVKRPFRESVVTVVGQPPQNPVARYLTVGNPVEFSGGVFERVLARKGIEIEGGVVQPSQTRLRGLYQGTTEVARFLSPKLTKLVRRVNKHSDNLIANALLKAIAAERLGQGSFQGGHELGVEFLRSHQIHPQGFVMADGSGLSEENRITPLQLVEILELMWRSEHAQEFMDSLPAPGEGTLKYRLKGLKLRAKTGTLRDHSALSGYVVSSYGQTLAFSVLCNDVPSKGSARSFEDWLVKVLATWPQEL